MCNTEFNLLTILVHTDFLYKDQFIAYISPKGTQADIIDHSRSSTTLKNDTFYILHIDINSYVYMSTVFFSTTMQSISNFILFRLCGLVVCLAV